MTDISTLLKEAKPLYFKKKRQRRQFQACLAILFCLGGFSLFNHPIGVNIENEDEFYVTDTGGIIEEMGLPTDDYGLLKVS